MCASVNLARIYKWFEVGEEIGLIYIYYNLLSHRGLR